MLTGTFHPPAGINPLLVVSGNLPWTFLFAPVLAGALLLAAFALSGTAGFAASHGRSAGGNQPDRTSPSSGFRRTCHHGSRSVNRSPSRTMATWR